MSNTKKTSLIFYFVPLILLWLLLSYFCCQCNEHNHGGGHHGHHEGHEHNDNHENHHHEDTHQPDETTNTVALGASALTAAATPFAINFLNNDNLPDLKDSNGYQFKLGSDKHLMPIDTGLSDNLSVLKNYMGDNPNKRLTVIGNYKSSENNNTAFPNLGLARANNIKAHLEGLGFNSKQINIDAKQMDDLQTDADSILGNASSFAIDTLTAEQVDLEHDATEHLKEDIIKEPLILYFETNVSQINMTDVQKEKLLNIVNYVDKTEDAKVHITGYTDNQGDTNANLVIGQKRADFAASYLQENGLHASDMVVDALGEENPIASNDTEEGRAQNRRTEVTIK